MRKSLFEEMLMLPRVFFLVAAMLLFSVPLFAAEIYGQLMDAAQKAPLGAVVVSDCGGKSEIDRYGRYRLTGLPQRTNCALTINYRKLQSNPVKIYTSKNRNSANFMLKISSGRLLLIRR
jgi:hypothetical protein